MEEFDFIIIGTGAGGGTLAYRLASSGKRILILERGDFLPKEKENWDPYEVFTRGRYRTKEQWLDADDSPFEPFTHYCVGGNTKMYGAALLRMRESDFDEVHHFDGISPAWPIKYADFEKYYTEAEYLYSVHGTRGLDPTEPPASKPYPFPALEPEPRMKKLFEDFQRLGCHPAPLAIAVRPGDDKPYPQAKVNLSYFDGYPDLTEAKADAHVVAINKALVHDNVTLLTDCYVEKLETEGSGKKVTKVKAIRYGQEMTFKADTIVVSAGAVNSAALLLRSANDRHPQGLANSSDQVGRNYMMHNNGSVVAISKTPNPSVFQKSLAVMDFYHGAEDSKYPLGSIQMMGKTDPDTLKDEIKELMPDADLEEVSTHSIDFFITAEDLPKAGNRVTLSKDGLIKTSYAPNNMEAYNRLKRKINWDDG